MIIKHQLGILKDLLKESSVTLHVTFVPTQKNNADSLTRVCKEWLSLKKKATNGFDRCCSGLDMQEVQSHGCRKIVISSKKM